MTDKKNGWVFAILKAVLWIASVFYGIGMVVRALLYKFKIFERHSVPMKIISVGNVTLGGTGKTPFVIELTRIFKEEFRKEPAVLIRGYGWDRTRLDTLEGARIWTGQGIFTHNPPARGRSTSTEQQPPRAQTPSNGNDLDFQVEVTKLS